MTDKAAAEDPATCFDETTQQHPQPVDLKFPTIDLNTSFESLLSHSTPTASEASTIMITPTSPPPALDESWASLDISEFSHDDDDTQSVNTDPGSLVDLSDVHDTESAAEDESQDEVEVDEERVAKMLKRRITRHNGQANHSDLQELSACDAVEDSIILQESEIQSSDFGIKMEHVRSTLSASDSQDASKETISMEVSLDLLKPFKTPVKIYYYGSPYSKTKDELLGKIGAALLVPTASSTSQTPTTSTCFNIVPTEFGPGSKPAFADLIPSQTQMTVDELSVVLNPADQHQHDTMRFALRRGVVLDSMLGNLHVDGNCKDFQPDLLVIHLSEKDGKDRGSQLSALHMLAHRHCWPTIIVADDDSFTANRFDHAPKKYGIQITTSSNDESEPHQSIRPIDLESFMSLDTVQLSRHIRHIMDYSFDVSSTQEVSSLAGTILRCFSNARPRQYVLRVTQAKSEELSSELPRQPLLSEVKQLWSTTEGRKRVKDVVFTLIVMMLSFYIVGFSQNLSTKVNERVGLNSTTSISNQMPSTATVTATSAIATTTTISTAIAASNQDVALYDPVLFDQMWYRLTGRPLAEQEVDKSAKEFPAKGREVIEPGVPKKLSNDTMYGRLTQWLCPKIDAVRRSDGDGMFLKYVKSLPRYKMRIEIEDLHEKLQDFYRDVTANVPKMSLSNRKHLHDLVGRSQHLLKETQWAGEKKLEKLVAEQKTLLSHAQHQARHIISAKKKKRTAFFKRG